MTIPFQRTAIARTAGAFQSSACVCTVLVLASLAFDRAHAADVTPEPESAVQPKTLPDVNVNAQKPWMFNIETKRAHLLPEVNGTTITVTKRNSVAKLEDETTVIDGNVRELFRALPGVLVSEQQTPQHVNLNYRGIGNPQEAEYVLSLQDGIPLVSDWIGYPTMYFLPAPQSLDSIQLIRGGSSLLYGPEPGAVINYVSRKPAANVPLAGRTENVFGSHNLFSTFNELSGTSGPWEYLVNLNYRHSDGERTNGGYDVRASDMHLGYKLAPMHKVMLDVHAYSANIGSAGTLFYPQYLLDAGVTSSPRNRVWVDRFTAVLSYEGRIDDKTLVTSKLWSGYQDLTQRSAANFVPPATPPATTTLDDQKFHYTGVDTRVRHDWGQGGALTAGFVYYTSNSPWRQNVLSDLSADRYSDGGTARLRQDRDTNYYAVFAENVFRFGKFHIVPSMRIEHEEVTIHEKVKPGTSPLLNKTFARDIPLLGLGFGHDFGVGHESYVNISQGYRPLRYLDVASPFSNLAASNNPDPATSVSYEAGVHGWPQKGLYYDVGVFQVDFKNRIESQRLNTTDTINVNSGDTRHRGIELEGSWDLWAERAASDEHLVLFGNLSLLDAVFTASSISGRVGLRPAFAPKYVARAGVTWSQEKKYKMTVSAVSVASQYWQDSNQLSGTGSTFIPAEIPQHTVLDLAGEYFLTDKVRLIGGITNLSDKKYYSRVFSGIEPANRRGLYLGARVDL